MVLPSSTLCRSTSGRRQSVHNSIKNEKNSQYLISQKLLILQYLISHKLQHKNKHKRIFQNGGEHNERFGACVLLLFM